MQCLMVRGRTQNVNVGYTGRVGGSTCRDVISRAVYINEDTWRSRLDVAAGRIKV